MINRRSLLVTIAMSLAAVGPLSAFMNAKDASVTHFYSGQNVDAQLIFDENAVSQSHAEQAGVFRMNSTIGQDVGVPAYKMALGAETTCGAGSSPCWGMTTVLTTNAGYPSSNIQVTHEFDQNNHGVSCPDVDIGKPGTVPCGTMLVTGAGSRQVGFGLGIAGLNKVRNGVVFFSNGPIATSIRDYSPSQVAYKDSGSHIVGFDGSEANYKAAFLVGPHGSFEVDPHGYVRGKAFIGELATPSSSHAACRPGQMADDARFHYVCVAQDRWRRVALSDF